MGPTSDRLTMNWLRGLVNRLLRRFGLKRDDPSHGDDGKDIYPLW